MYTIKLQEKEEDDTQVFDSIKSKMAMMVSSLGFKMMVREKLCAKQCSGAVPKKKCGAAFGDKASLA